MKKALAGLAILSAICALSSCLTTTEKDIMDPPWKPAADAGSSAVSTKPPVGQVVPVYFSKDSVPVIDGKFDEWEGLAGADARVMVYGGIYNPDNSSGHFVVRTDGSTLYLFADVGDDSPNVNTFPAPQAWRGDSIEFFIGTDTGYHTFYKSTDKRIRVVPKSKANKFQFDLAVNDVSIQNSDVKTAIVFSDKGYRIESAIPLSLLNIKSLKLKQKVRLEFQVNDADNGKERTRLLHWMSEKDVSYMDASTWGDGKVAALPAAAEALSQRSSEEEKK